VKLHTHINECGPFKKPFVTTGTFDGVHYGHRIILDKLMENANRHHGETVLITFDPHPRKVLFPDDQSLKLLTTLDEKKKLLEKLGIEHLVICPFTEKFSRMGAFEFIRDILVNKIGVHKLMIGYDHQFGRNREGSWVQLEENAQLFGFELEEIPAQDIDDIKVSSTKIRKALAEGRVELAKQYLGYAYTIEGTVMHGDKVGRSLGYPTANIQLSSPDKLTPGQGVYAVTVQLEETTHYGMLNSGMRPTVSAEQKHPSLEVHIFDFEGDLYGQSIQVTFHQKIRDELKFESRKALIEQLNKDQQRVQFYFNTLN
jgi:riboflavin kinase/FMN adenylyltransferase